MFEIGSKVTCIDGEPGGSLQYLVLDPQGEVSDLVIDVESERGSRIVSVADVGLVDPGTITLNISCDEVLRRRAFQREEMLVPSDEVSTAAYQPDTLYMWMNPYAGTNVASLPPRRPMTKVRVDHGVGDRFSIVGQDTPVLIRGGKRIGTVDHLVVDPESYQPQHIVVRLPGIRRRRVLIPADRVGDWERTAILVDLSPDELKALPPFTSQRPDTAVSRDVRDALRNAGIKTRALDVDCRDGHVSFGGHVDDDEARRTADRLARQVLGVLSLTNHLTTDRMLEARVQSRLYDDPVASLYPLKVDVDGGRVTVSGLVPNQAVRHVVIETIDAVSGVTDIVDQLEEDGTAFVGDPAVATVKR